MTMTTLFSYRKTFSEKAKSQVSTKRLRMEPLEERQMLAVTGVSQAEFEKLDAAYPELNLGDYQTDYVAGTHNIVSIDAATATAADLVAAITAAKDTTGNDLIVIKLNGNTTIDISSQLEVHDDTSRITFVTYGDGTLTLNAQQSGRIFDIKDSNVQIAGMSLTGGTVTGNGGAISFVDSGSDNTLVLSSLTLYGNRANTNDNNTGFGGAIYQEKGYTELYNVLMYSNTAGREGGAMAIGRGSSTGRYTYATIINVTVADNNAASYAGIYGGISGNNSTVEIYNSIFYNNSGKNDVYIATTQDGKATFTNNLYSGPGKVYIQKTAEPAGNDSGNPNLVNYKPTSASEKVVDKVTNIKSDVLATDIAGLARKLGKATDLGAFEFKVLNTVDDSYSYDLNRNTNEDNLVAATIDILENDSLYFAREIELAGVDSATGYLLDPVSGAFITNMGTITLNDNNEIIYTPGSVFDKFSFQYRVAGEDGEWSEYATVTVTPTYSGALVVSELLDKVDGDYSSGNLSLREALMVSSWLKNTGSGQQITFADDLDGNLITLENGAFDIYHNAKIIAPETKITIDADGNSNIFNLYGTSSALIGVTLENFTLTGGSATNGGAIYAVNTNLALVSVDLNDNAASRGGGLYQDGGSSTLTGVFFSANRAKHGGGMYLMGGSTSQTISTYTDNFASLDGAGLCLSTPTTVTITGSAFAKNIATNTEESRGGAIYQNRGTVTITTTTFEENKAARGAGLYQGKGSLTVSVSDFDTNTAYLHGGGMYQTAGTSTLNDVSFSGNVASRDGGGLCLSNSLTVTLNAVILDGNLATHSRGRGAGLYQNGKVLVATDTEFTSNTSSGQGGGYYNNGGQATLIGEMAFSSNSARNGGGGIAFVASTASDNSIVVKENATAEGEILAKAINEFFEDLQLPF